MRIHFIAIGGSAMHNLALALKSYGHDVSGSDDEIFEPSKSRLAKAGLLPLKMGWNPESINDSIDAIILGMHARKDNPELLRAQSMGLKIYSYPEFIYEQSKEKTRVVITGSHGKTTITSMVLHVLRYHNREIDYMVGALIDGFDTMVELSDNEFIVLEGDEYLSSPIDMRPKFIHYKPNIALLSGIAWDHINVFPTFEVYKQQFADMLNTIEKGGALIYNEEDPIVVELVKSCKNEFKTFPYKTPPYTVVNGETFLHTEDGDVLLSVMGEHNLNNLEGARWICLEIGIQEEEFYEAIGSFKGAGNRLEFISSNSNGSKAFKDFAHAPSKVMATTKAVKNQFMDKTVMAVLELHTFSSLNPEFLDQYKGALDAADLPYVYFNPKAVEHKKLPPLTVDDVRQAFGNQNIKVFNDSNELFEVLKEEFNNPAILLFMSSGNFNNIDVVKKATDILNS